MRQSYRKKLEDALWKLLDYAQELNVTVRFIDPRIDMNIWGGMFGYFDCQQNQVTVFKGITTPLRVQHVHTLAHELRHAEQFKLRMSPTEWLACLGVYPAYSNARHSQALEDDADQAANEFMIKNKLSVPTAFSEDLV